jgi:hypothetical protein
MYILWAIAPTLLLTGGAFWWLVVVPKLKETSVARQDPETRRQAIWESIVDKHESGGRASLTEREQVWWDVWAFVHMTSSGGFKHWLEVTAGEDIDLLIDSLRKIGAADLQRGVTHLRDNFPGGKPNANAEKRIAQLEKVEEDDIPWPEDIEIDEEKAELLTWKYWQAQKSQ